tara:strand:- start:6098 stop:7687 length:1590 start_codon:yes stop_codon:yes gene_type:complete
MIPKLINKIYVINLKSCYDRKKHIEKEFKRLKINNYEIFEATDKDSLQVQEMMKTNFVKKFPPCFRCNKNKCGCSNNILIKHQIGNWCSFINVMNDIIKNDYKGLIMICEDDIKFTDDGMKILNKMITKDNLEKYNISFEKPILIRAEQRGNFPPLNKLKLTKKITMSNACFIINKFYAESFINNLKIIDRTSDMYLQIKILQYDKNIQHFTIEPSPAYQLSDNKNSIFKSEIHPKGLNKEDKIRAKTHFKRVEYKDYLDNISYINNRNLWYSSCNNNRNVGDLIGKYIYEKITGNKINYIHPKDTKDKVYLTCGSIIQYKHVKYNNTIIWGSGIMFEKINKFNSKIFAVRGKKTAEILAKLDIKCPQIFGDIALLLPRFFNPKNLEKYYDIGLIFHWSHLDKDIINFLKQRYKLKIISVDLEIENFVTEVLKCKYTISSSLHGVIISHSYGVQSLPFNLEETGLNGTFFKFEDYYSIFDLQFKPYFKNDILNSKNIINLIKNYNQPKFPINTDKLYNSCPFLKIPNTV